MDRITFFPGDFSGGVSPPYYMELATHKFSGTEGLKARNL